MKIRLRESESKKVKKKTLDLSDFDSVKKWIVSRNLDDLVNEEGDDLDYTYIGHNGSSIENLIKEYMWFFIDYKDEKEITIYRLLRLNTIDDLELDDIGKYWSFDESGVGDYGSGTREFKGDEKFILTGLVNPKNIDWEYGFTSYLYYPNQSECALKSGTKVKIIAIDDVELQKNLIGIVK